MSANGDEIPPDYYADDQNNVKASVLTDDLGSAFCSLKLSGLPPAFPKADHCLAHLKLLRTFHALKDEIGNRNGLFNLWDWRCEKAENKHDAWAMMREKRWALYIARAVERFEDWWLKVLVHMEPSKRLEAKDMRSTNLNFRHFTKKGRARQWKPEMLPPTGTITASYYSNFDTDNDSRCYYGVACIYVESTEFLGRLYQVRTERPVGYRVALGGYQCVY